MAKRAAVVFILIAAFFGLADSAYLAQHEINGTPLLCNIQNLAGCNVVAQSPYSHLFGIPLSEYGILFYGLVFALAAFELVIFDRLLRRALQALALFGLASSLYFTALQVFVINALCIYCMASALLAIIIFLLAFFIEPVRRSLAHGERRFAMPPLA
ncbi:vitamin K epoxide reductase family protein [Candidatus Kaiserbacteria bacterium]|nr:vitamin K epoxide reductase family protein [Candidatus Kaiserbacteria bacterium]